MSNGEGSSLNPSSSDQSVTQSWEEVWDALDSPDSIDVADIADNGDLTGYLRYAKDTDSEDLAQKGLHPVRAPVPQWFQYASPAIYYLTEREQRRLNEGASPKQIQTACEEDDRVLYNVLAETDEFDHRKGRKAQTVIGWLTAFAEDYLGLDGDDYEFYFSGNRSIHLHTNEFVPGEKGLNWLKERAETFNEEEEGELDTSIYTRKPQFRLPGVEHYRTELPKVPITEDATREDITRALMTDPHRELFFEVREKYYSYTAGDDGRATLLPEFRDEAAEEYLKSTEGDTIKDGSNRESSHTIIESPFSPYANTGDGERSVIVMEQTGDVVERDGTYYVEAYIREARGGDGSFRRYNHEGHVKLSARDARKWEFESGDTVVVLGGRSRSSRLIDLTEDDPVVSAVAAALYVDGKDAAIEALEDFEYDVGGTGHNGPKREGSTEPRDAAIAKREIERGERPLTYDSIFRVSCRLLRMEGWNSARNWIEREFGEEFDPEQTHEYLSKAVETYEDYNHVDVPEPP